MPESKAAYLNVTVLPLLVFNALGALAINFVVFPLYKHGIMSMLAKQCTASAGAASDLPRTGLVIPDSLTCIMVNLFHSALDSQSRPFLIYMLYSFSYISILPSVEAARAHVPIRAAYPLIVGLLNQTVGIALVLPMYLMFLIHDGVSTLHLHAQVKPERAKIDQAQAEALLFGLVAGFVVPTVCLFHFNHPYTTLAWQLAPVWVYLSQHAHLYFRPSSRYPESGYRTVQATYATLFLLSAVPHAIYVLPRLVLDRSSAVSLFLPPLSLPTGTVTIEQGVLYFFKWDAWLAFAASACAVLWFARSLRQVGAIAAWLAAGTLAFGPGAAIATLWMWREKALADAQKTTKVN